MTSEDNSVLKYIRKTDHVIGILFDVMDRREMWVHECDGAGNVMYLKFYNKKANELITISLIDNPDECDLSWFKEE